MRQNKKNKTAEVSYKSASAGEKMMQFWLTIMFTVLCVLIVFPFILLISVSLSDEKDIVFNGYNILPRVFSTASYSYIFKNPASIFNA